jgi:anti-sigma factor RsiW
MMHDPWTDRLSEYLDGELGSEEQAAIERHLTACPTCRAVLADLRQVVARAGTLADSTIPPADLWPGISAQIAASAERARTVTPIRRRRVFSLPQLAAAAIAAAVASGGLAWWAANHAAAGVSARPIAMQPAPAPTSTELPAGVRPAALAAEPKYDAAVADLERVLAQGRGTLDPKTVQVVEQNLARIDKAIADARRALAADPNNADLIAHLARTMRWKIDLLRQAAGLAVRQS